MQNTKPGVQAAINFDALPCRNCSKPVKKIIRWGMTEWTHALGENDKCRPQDPFSGRAYPVKHCEPCNLINEEHSHCPKCNATGCVYDQSNAWADYFRCPTCGHEERYSLGD